MSEEKKDALVLRTVNLISDTTFDRIWKFYYEKSAIELKPKEEEIRSRLVNIWGLLGDILTDRAAIQAHMQWCNDQGYRIKETTAYEDLRYSKMLFGDRRQQTKAAKKAIVSEWLLKAIKHAWEKRENEFFLGQFQALIRRYNKLNGLEDDQAVPAERPAVQINFSSDPEVLRKQAEDLRRKFENVDAQDITPEQ
jgi:hypothetical protein